MSATIHEVHRAQKNKRPREREPLPSGSRKEIQQKPYGEFGERELQCQFIQAQEGLIEKFQKRQGRREEKLEG